MEAYELAAELLLKPGEPCWSTGGSIWVDEHRVPRLTGWVVVGKDKPGEKREAEFIYADSDWRELA